jgi:hypothetical protein
MRTLTLNAQRQARSFIEQQARPLEQARYAYHFLSGPREAVLTALAAFQNPDGGFGKALEPDFRLPDSSALATTTGLQILCELGIGSDHPLVQGAMRYLVNTIDPTHLAWTIIPSNADAAPHAPWWVYNPDLTQHLNNPRPEIAGYFFLYGDLVPADLRARLIESVMQQLERIPDTLPPSAFHELLCYVRLATIPTTQQESWREPLLHRITALADALIATDPDTWDSYVMRPLMLVNHPAGLFADTYAGPVGVNLDYAIEHQNADGAWLPNWSWGGLFPEAWAVAEREWTGVITLDTLKALHAFGRWE